MFLTYTLKEQNKLITFQPPKHSLILSSIYLISCVEREKGRRSLNHHLDLKLVAYEITYGNFHNNQMYYKGCMKIYTIQT